ncbi:MAG: hypothetical protein AAFQ15_02575 [Pseudomonadota bacterium]
MLQCDAGEIFDLYATWLDLAPINTGSAMRRPAKRGDWIYVPSSASVKAFRDNRRAKQLTKGYDSVVEVSLRCDVYQDDFQRLFSIVE